MRRVLTILILVGGLMAGGLSAATPESEIRTALADQEMAWNQGDLVKFVAYYSPESVFIGKEVARGNEQVLARYRKSYPTAEKRGTLHYSDLEVKILGAEYASVIGWFHLTRTAAGGGDASGIFTLLFRKTAGEWKIILDHTS